MGEISRRDFLKSTAIGAVGVASIGLLGGCVGGDKEDKKDKEEAKKAHNPVRTEKCDLVVIGSGTAGLCTAVRAAELGASVILLEKLSTIGGTSAFAEGIGGLNSFMNKNMGPGGKPFKVGEVVKRVGDFAHWNLNAPVLSRYLSESGKTIDWLHFQCGVQFLSATGTTPKSYPTWHVISIDGEKGLIGKGVHKPLIEYGKNHGLKDIRLSSPATGLIVEDGTVKGVYVQDQKKNEEYTIEAKNTVLATGGYSNNKEMFKRFTFLDLDNIHDFGTREGRDGDGIRWAEEIGAAFHNPGGILFAYPTVKDDYDFNSKVAFMFAQQRIIHVNEQGERFFNEENIADVAIVENAMKTQKRVFSMLDQTYLEYIRDKAVTMGWDAPGFAKTGQPYPDASKVINEGIKKGTVQKFETTEEIANYIGCDVKAFQDTIAKYNQACHVGVDDDFGLSAMYLHPMKTAPFYVAEIIPTMFATMGGLDVDKYLRVVNTKGEPIPGLFALGCDASSIYGTDYDIDIVSGSQQGWCATGGRLVAEYVMDK